MFFSRNLGAKAKRLNFQGSIMKMNFKSIMLKFHSQALINALIAGMIFIVPTQSQAGAIAEAGRMQQNASINGLGTL